MSKNKSFLKTNVPYYSKSGVLMRYVIIDEKGDHHDATRQECLNHNEEACLYVDTESGFVARMPKCEEYEVLCHDNRKDFWREQKFVERKCACYAKGTAQCSVTCESCSAMPLCDLPHQANKGAKCTKKCEFCSFEQSRIVEMDKLADEGNESITHYFKDDESKNPSEIVEKTSELELLDSALASLSETELNLIIDRYAHKKTVRELAPKYNYMSTRSISVQERKILEKLRKNEDLQNSRE